ncbi:MAG: choice-of-anchor D domain-containing protein, partial [Lentisphaerae bacterium]|nr:choice-of-anchor D domain-containing protein [Lentisphaerota bacterium]
DLGSESGSAYVYERDAGGPNAWGQVAKLTASDGAAADNFGCSVSVAGDVALVGAFGDDSRKGSAYMFERNAGGTNAWGQVAKLTAADGAVNDCFGVSVSVAGDVALVGAPWDDDLGTNSGSAYVFERNAGGTNAWGQVAKLTAADGTESNEFGISVSVAGDVALVGAFGDDSFKGSAYVFERNAGGTNAWGQVAKLIASDGAAGDYLGVSVSVAGNLALVGASFDDDLGSESGSAYVYERNAGGTNAWGQVRKLTASDGVAGDYFGWSVSVAGDVALVGAYRDDNLGAIGSDFGSVYVYERNAGGTNAWAQVAQLIASDYADSDFFGQSVSVAGDVALVGSYRDDDHGGQSGSAYVFEGLLYAPLMLLLGTNGAPITNGAAADAGNGTLYPGAVWPGQSVTNTFGITNSGQYILTIGSVSTSGAGAAHFTVAGLPPAVEPGAVSNFTVTFAPTVGGGAQTAQVTFVNSSTNTPYILNLVGTSVNAQIAVLGTNGAGVASGEGATTAKGTHFGALLWGQALTNTFRITNGGQDVLTITGLVTSGPQASAFSVLAWPATVTPGGVSNFSVTFGPSSGGTFVAQIGIAHNSTGASYAVNLYGTGAKHDQAIANFTPTNGSVFATTSKVVLAATASSGLPISFSVTSGSGTLSGGTNLTFTGSGAVSLVARQTGNTSWNAAPSVTQTIAVVKVNQTISFAAIPDQLATNSVRLNATASSGLPVSFGVASGPGELAGGTDLTFTDSGSVSLVASQAGNALWNAAPDVTRTFALAKVNQTITFGAIQDQMATNVVQLSATASSGLPVSFGVASGPGELAGGTNLTFTGSGVVSLMASQSGNALWNAAPDVTITIAVNKAQQAALTFNPTSPQTYNTTNVLSASGGSGTGAISYAVESGPGQLVGGNNLWMASGTGTVTVIATKAADALFNGLAVTAQVIAAKASQTISFPPLQDQSVTGTVGLVATASSGLSVSFDVASGPGSLASGTNLSFTGTGLVLVAASQTGDANWSAAVPVVNVVKVGAFSQAGNDYDGDGQSDLAIFDSNTGYWYVRSVSGTAIAWAIQWGWPGAKAVEGDYEGDGVCDMAVFDGNTGYWYIRTVSGEALTWATGWGWPGAIPVSGDYDDDGLSDMAVFDNNTGSWYIRSVAGELLAWSVSWGWPGAIPVPGDFDGDGPSDLAVFDSNTGYWFIRTLSGTTLAWAVPWGWPGAVPVSGDYDGDGVADIAVFDGNTGYWYIRTVNGTTLGWAMAWGWPGGVPVPGDFDGDGISDLALFDGNTGYWYIRTMSGTTLVWSVGWGWPGAIPVGSLHSYY